MLTLLLVAAIICIATFVLRQRLYILVIVVLVAIVSGPFAASPLIIGDAALLAPLGVWCIFTVLLLLVLFHSNAIIQELRSAPVLYGSLLLFCSHASITGFVTKIGLELLVGQVLGSLALFMVTRIACRQNPERGVRVIAAGYTGVALFEAGFAILQYVYHDVLVYEQAYRRFIWFDAVNGRYMGTLDHPLTLSLFVCVALPMLVRVERTWLCLPMMATLLAGIVVSQSRTGLIVGVAASAYVLLARQVRLVTKILSVSVLASGLLVLGSTSFVREVGYRFIDDENSAAVRFLALRYYSEYWADYLVVGEGLGSSYALSSGLGLASSFESSFVMYAIDLGFMGAVVYFGTQVLLVCRQFFKHPHYAHFGVAGIVAVVIPQTYSALATQTAASSLVWLVLALGSCSGMHRVDMLARSGAEGAKPAMVVGNQGGSSGSAVVSLSAARSATQ